MIWRKKHEQLTEQDTLCTSYSTRDIWHTTSVDGFFFLNSAVTLYLCVVSVAKHTGNG